MTGNQTMDYYVRPRHIYSHSRTCTHSSLCRRPSNLVAFHVCYLLDHANIQEISALVTFIPEFPVYIKYLQPRRRSWFIVYCTWRWPHMKLCISCLFMAIVLLCIRNWYMYLQSHANINHCIMLMSGWFIHLGLHYSTSRMDFIIYFGHHVTPLTSHIRGHLSIVDFTTLGRSHIFGLPCPSADSLNPMELYYTFML